MVSLKTFNKRSETLRKFTDRRLVANFQHTLRDTIISATTEMMLALGLEDKMVGTAMKEEDIYLEQISMDVLWKK